MSRTPAIKKAIDKYEQTMKDNNWVWTKVRVPKHKVDDIRKEAEKMRLSP